MMCAVVLRHLFTLHENLELRFRLERAYAAEQARARIDPVTGSLNRPAILEAAEALVAKGESFALGMADIDRMKSINDNLGHQAGDEALLRVAQALACDGALVGRYGGDEFLVIVPDAGFSDEQSYRQAVNAGLLELSQGRFSLTLSIGLVSSTGKSDVTELISAADSAMYVEKRRRLGPQDSLVAA